MAYRLANAFRPDPTPKAKPVKRGSYLAFIRRLPCCVTSRADVEAAHVSFAAPRFGHYGRGKGNKAPDRWALPLSSAEHRRQHDMNEEGYWRSVGINPHLLCLIIWGLWSDLGDDAEPFAAAIIHSLSSKISEAKP